MVGYFGGRRRLIEDLPNPLKVKKKGSSRSSRIGGVLMGARANLGFWLAMAGAHWPRLARVIPNY
jgi:hypothetical protein